MTTRILPPEEWARLNGTELETVYPVLNPDTASILVVESADGAIVGCWALFPVLHCEGLWIAPDSRKRAGVARRLWEAMRLTARRAGVQSVATAACNDEVRRLLDRAGAVKLPGDHYAMRMT